MAARHVDDMLSFAGIVRAGSIAAASRERRLPASTLSRRLSALERRLGVRLLDRTTRSIALTEAGEAYYARCARIAEEVAEADALVQSHGRAPRGLLRLAAPPLLGALFLAEPLAEYVAKYPSVRVQTVLGERLVDLRKESFDVALRTGGPPSDGSYIVRKLGQTTRLLCASPAYLERHGTPRSMSGLRDHALIALGAGPSPDLTWRFLDGERGETPLSVEPRIRTNSVPLIHGLCRQGAGIALLPRFLVADDLRSGALVELRLGGATSASDVFVLMPAASAATPKVRAFVELFGRYVNQRKPWS